MIGMGASIPLGMRDCDCTLELHARSCKEVSISAVDVGLQPRLSNQTLVAVDSSTASASSAQIVRLQPHASGCAKALPPIFTPGV